MVNYTWNTWITGCAEHARFCEQGLIGIDCEQGPLLRHAKTDTPPSHPYCNWPPLCKVQSVLPGIDVGSCPGWQDGGRFEREASRQLAAELLEAVLKLKEAGVSTPDRTFPYLLVRISPCLPLLPWC